MPRTAQIIKKAVTTPNLPSLTLVNDCPRAMSTDVAAYFGKQHQHIMRQIRNVLDNCDKNWGQSNFGLTSYTDEQGRPQPCYSMTKDGFTLLAMGFTGLKAMQFKISYIEAFNRMEAELTAWGRASLAQTRALHSTVEDRRPLNKLIKMWGNLAHISHINVWRQIKTHFKVDHAEHLTANQVKEACALLQDRIDKLGPPRERPTLPPPRPKSFLGLPGTQTIKIPDLEKLEQEAQAIVTAACALHDMLDPFMEVHRQFTESLLSATIGNNEAKSLFKSVDMFGIYVNTLAGVGSRTIYIVNHVIAGYELVAALQKGQA